MNTPDTSHPAPDTAPARAGLGAFAARIIADGDNEPSTMRVCVLLIVAGFMFVWCWLSIQTGRFAEPPLSMISLILGALGAKSAQAWAENLPETGGTKP